VSWSSARLCRQQWLLFRCLLRVKKENLQIRYILWINALWLERYPQPRQQVYIVKPSRLWTFEAFALSLNFRNRMTVTCSSCQPPVAAVLTRRHPSLHNPVPWFLVLLFSSRCLFQFIRASLGSVRYLRQRHPRALLRSLVSGWIKLSLYRYITRPSRIPFDPSSASIAFLWERAPSNTLHVIKALYVASQVRLRNWRQHLGECIKIHLLLLDCDRQFGTVSVQWVGGVFFSNGFRKRRLQCREWYRWRILERDHGWVLISKSSGTSNVKYEICLNG
jgi:hypothetical protein